MGDLAVVSQVRSVAAWENKSLESEVLVFSLADSSDGVSLSTEGGSSGAEGAGSCGALADWRSRGSGTGEEGIELGPMANASEKSLLQVIDYTCPIAAALIVTFSNNRNRLRGDGAVSNLNSVQLHGFANRPTLFSSML